MKFTKITSLIKADAVLNELQNNDKRTRIESLVECYQNGREHGYILWSFYTYDDNGKLMAFLDNKAYYICVGRRTDAIYVYKGSYAMQFISEDAYKFNVSFDNPADAAIWIIEDIEKEELSAKSK